MRMHAIEACSQDKNKLSLLPLLLFFLSLIIRLLLVDWLVECS